MVSTALDDLLESFRREDDLHASSLIVSFLGDAIVPRGGVVSAASIRRVMSRIGIEPGTVRTALSRLARDDRVVRETRGRESFYRLSRESLAPFQAASPRIYASSAESFVPHAWTLLITDRDGQRDPVELVEPSSSPWPCTSIRLRAGVWLVDAPPVTVRERLASTCLLVEGSCAAAPPWLVARLGLGALAADHRRLMRRFTALANSPPRQPLDALAARCLLVHAWRRLLSRMPELPPGLLPTDWPAPDCRRFTARLYRQLLPASTRWLDDEASGPGGTLPPDAAEVAWRFTDRRPDDALPDRRASEPALD